MKVWIFVVLLCGAILTGAFLILLSIIIYNYRVKKKQDDKNSAAQEEQKIKLGYLGPPSKVTADLSSHVPQFNCPNNERTTPSLSLAQKPVATPRKNPYEDLLVSRFADETWNCSAEESDAAVEEGKMSGAGSEEDISSKLAATTKTSINYVVSYDHRTSMLTVTIERVTNLPVRYRKNCSSLAKVSVIGSKKNKVTHYTNVHHKTLNPNFNESFEFRLNSDDEEKLRFCVYVKYHLSDKLIGETIMPVKNVLQQLTDENQSVGFTTVLQRRKPKKKKERFWIENANLGQLFVLMQYQTGASRVKILIRKGDNLPKINTIRNTEYYIILNLMKDNVPIAYKETKLASGSNPVWNEPFLFDIPSKEDVNCFWFQFLIMRGRLSHKDGAIGHVLIGSDTTASGDSHWNEMMQPRSTEVAKWHDILPFR